MSRALPYLNLAGVVILMALSILQWQSNRRLNLEISRLEKLRLEQSQRIDEQDLALKGASDDLAQLRTHLARLTEKSHTADKNVASARVEITQLASERDQLKQTLQQWSDAVAARDQQLEDAAQQIRKLADDRNDAVVKFNALAEKYNAAIQDLNDRTRLFNELAAKQKAAARP